MLRIIPMQKCREVMHVRDLNGHHFDETQLQLRNMREDVLAQPV